MIRPNKNLLACPFCRIPYTPQPLFVFMICTRLERLLLIKPRRFTVYCDARKFGVKAADFFLARLACTDLAACIVSLAGPKSRWIDRETWPRPLTASNGPPVSNNETQTSEDTVQLTSDGIMICLMKIRIAS